ncbi:MAG: glutamate--tRNA ligase [Armatimonadota bacterium]
MKKVRVRFAPSPTGHLHIGSARTALFNWLFARSRKGVFVLRIEDTDKARSKKEYLDSILRDLKWLGLNWDEGPYFQTERLDMYKEYADKLLEKGYAYRCFCTKEELENRKAEGSLSGYNGKCRDLKTEEAEKLTGEGKEYVIRFKVDKGITVFNDLVRGKVEFDNDTIEDFIIVKSSGIPVYNFAVVVDDITMRITHVIRGEEHISNTPRQIMIFSALGEKQPLFAHIPIVLNPDKTKLSKRAGAATLDDFAGMGYLPEALINFLSLLGWSSGDDKDIMDVGGIIEKFSMDRITKSAAVFDDDKLSAVNASHIRKMSDNDLAGLLKDFNKARVHKDIKDGLIENLAPLYKERITTLRDFFNDAGFFFEDEISYDEKDAGKYFKGDFFTPAFEKIIKEFSLIESFDLESTEKIIRGIAAGSGIGAGKLIQPVRLAVSGRCATPPIFDVLVMLGRDKVIERLKKALLYAQTGG